MSCAPRIDGTIIEKQVRVGQFVEANEVLFTIADLSRVWLILDIYESELSWVQLGQPVEITLESDRRSVTGNVGFIEPVLNDTTRTAQCASSSITRAPVLCLACMPRRPCAYRFKLMGERQIQLYPLHRPRSGTAGERAG